MSKILADRLVKLRKEKGLTQGELALALNISRGTYAHYEIGKRHPDYDTLKMLATFFRVSADYLLGHSAEIDGKINGENTSLVRIPILGEIKAGYDLYAEQQIIGYELAPKSEVSDGEYFYLKVTGDSMIDEGIREGYLVLVRRQNYVDNGKIGVVIVNGDEGTLKRVFYQDNTVILQAANKNIPPKIVTAEDAMIQGQVIRVTFEP